MRLAEFDNHILISYAHIDDKPLNDGQKGWVENFHRSLEWRVEQLLGEDLRVWRDPHLAGNDVFEDEIEHQVGMSAVLVSVLTPRYVNSDWCCRELEEFCIAAKSTGGLRLGNKSRIFKVIKTPVGLDKHPVPIRDLTGYRFFEPDASDRVRELTQYASPERRHAYLDRLEDVAQDICTLLQIMRDPDNLDNGATAGVPVYLARTSFDLSGEHDAIRRELEQHGHAVLPDRELPPTAPEFEETVRECLSRCRLSIHLVGSNYGDVPAGGTKSIVELQNELACERSGDPGFVRLIWMPSDLPITDESQDSFIARLDADSQLGAEVLKSPIEDLKTLIHELLDLQVSSRESATAVEPGRTRPVRIYLIHDAQDAEGAGALRTHLLGQKSRSLEVIPQLLDEDETVLRKDHEASLELCDIALVYWGEARESWQRVKTGDLRRAAYGRGGAKLRMVLFIAPPETRAKRDFLSNEIEIIRSPEAFSPNVLEPFLASLGPEARR